jgi:hypothetical protein
MLPVLVGLNVVLAAYAFWLWRLDGPTEPVTRLNRRNASLVFILIAILFAPLTGFVGWRSVVADRQLAGLVMAYPGATVRWVPGEAEALGMLALFHAGPGEVAAADSLTRAVLAAAHSTEPRHWYAQTRDAPARVLDYYRPLLGAAGWALVEDGPTHLLGVRDRERFMITGTEGWTRTTITYTWFPPRASP